MKQSVLFWLLALLITAASAIYQRMTGPTYPQRGSVSVGGSDIRYRLERTHAGETPETVRIQTGDANDQGVLLWKHHKSGETWTRVSMTNRDGQLEANLPGQPPAGKLDYQISLERDGESVLIPAEPVVIRFRGDVPAVILIIHVTLMFGGMLLSTRTGFEFFSRQPKPKKLILWTITFLFLGGIILGPIVQKYAFGAFWTGWPFGHDLTDNKTAAALLAWIAAWYAMRRSAKPLRWILAAAVVTFVVYLIPHSVLGSELKYAPESEKEPAALIQSGSHIVPDTGKYFNTPGGAIA